MRRTLRAIILLMFPLVLAGCTTMPPELVAGGPYANITPNQALSGKYEQRRVRWGGVIIQTLPKGQRTCFEMSGIVLENSGEPLDSDISTGRFTACARGFFEPAIYSAGRYVTFTGRIDGRTEHKIANQVYAFPKLEADRVYLWPKRRDVVYVPYPVYGYHYYDPFWIY